MFYPGSENHGRKILGEGKFTESEKPPRFTVTKTADISYKIAYLWDLQKIQAVPLTRLLLKWPVDCPPELEFSAIFSCLLYVSRLRSLETEFAGGLLWVEPSSRIVAMLNNKNCYGQVKKIRNYILFFLLTSNLLREFFMLMETTSFFIVACSKSPRALGTTGTEKNDGDMATSLAQL